MVIENANNLINEEVIDDNFYENNYNYNHNDILYIFILSVLIKEKPDISMINDNDPLVHKYKEKNDDLTITKYKILALNMFILLTADVNQDDRKFH